MRKLDLLTAGLVLGVATLVFWFTDLDLRIQGWFYHPQIKSFEGEGNLFWDLLYHYGIFIGYLLAVAALWLISLSYWSERYLPFRKEALMLVVVVAIGPGILVNLLFKDHWGRPRPREITQFGGTEPFGYVWQMGKEGKSFPCGHCSMGFYLAVPFLILRNRRRILAYACLTLGIVYGLLLGIARIRAGAHFPSDVLWSGGVVWLTALAAYYGLKVYDPVKPSDLTQEIGKKKARRITLIIGIALPILTVGLLLATPYISRKELLKPAHELEQEKSRAIRGELYLANVNLEWAGEGAFQSRYKVNAFGFPNSKLGHSWKTQADTGLYLIQPSGWFTEVRNQVELKLPQSLPAVLRLEKGKFYLSSSLLRGKGQLWLKVEKGEVILRMNEYSDFVLYTQGSEVENQSGYKLEQLGRQYYTQPKAPLELHVQIGEGKLTIVADK
jgi:lipid A 4'-phosphatase